MICFFLFEWYVFASFGPIWTVFFLRLGRSTFALRGSSSTSFGRGHGQRERGMPGCCLREQCSFPDVWSFVLLFFGIFCWMA